MMLELGVHPVVVAEMLGNDPSVTMAVYSHSTRSMHAAAAAALDDAVLG